MLKIGFTGTRAGMTDNQKAKLSAFLVSRIRSQFIDVGEFHHGDCVGADADAHNIAHQIGYSIVTHPPLCAAFRAWKKADRECEPKEYLERNHDIVDSTTMLIATPRTRNEELRSGTWATIRYARKKKKDVFIFYP